MQEILSFLIERGYFLAAAFLGMWAVCHTERIADKKAYTKLYQEVLERFTVVSDV